MRLVRASLVALLLVVALAPPAVLAQGPLEMTTAFPAVVADPGGTAKFTVTVTTDTSQRVDLAVVESPPEWTVRLRGGGSTIAALFTSPNPELANAIAARFDAEVEVPEEVAPGQYQVEIEGRSSAGTTARLALDITIEEQVPGAVRLESDFPNQSGATDDTFTFDLELRNGTNQQVTFGFEADAPPGWEVEARPGTDTQATTAVVDAGGLGTVRVTITPAPDAAAGPYPILVRALGAPEPAEIELGVELVGDYGMDLNTSDQRQSGQVTAGGTTTITLVVTNTGSAPLSEVTMSATPPREWDVTFDQETIPAIQPDQSINVVATIQAAGNAVAGDYVVSVNARSEEAVPQEPVQLRMTVNTSPIGGLLGIAVLLAVAVGLFFVFQRYGRR